jgi:transcriptional regulator with XRE-family HTH domain
MGVQSPSTQTLAVSKRLRAILEKQLQEAAEQVAARHVELGARIKNARDARGWKPKHLAAAVSVEPVTVSRWERGVHAPDVGTIYLIAEKTGQSVGFFIDGLDIGLPASASRDVLELRLARLEAEVARIYAFVVRALEAVGDDAALRDALEEERQLRADPSVAVAENG